MSEYVRYPNYSTNSQCGECNKCCTPHVAVSTEDVIRIKDYVKLHTIIGVNSTTICTFWNSTTKGCSINEVKPEICQLFKCWVLPKTVDMIAVYDKAIYPVGQPISMYDIFYK